MNCKAVICCINSKYIHSSLAPWCLYAGVKAYCGKQVAAAVCEGTINENLDVVLERILQNAPNAVGFCCYIWNITYVKALAAQLRQRLPQVRIIFGGPETGFNAAQVLRENDFVDYVLCGEGEEAFPALLNAIAKGEEPPDGLAFCRRNGGIQHGNTHICLQELSPYCEEYFAALGTRIAYIESSRGCPYTCAFCLSGEDKNVRFFDLNRVKAEMLRLCKAGARTVKFIDRTFNCHRKRAMEILLFIKENYGGAIPDGVCFHFEIAADILTDDMLRLIAQMPTGSVQFEAGIQTFNEATLKLIRRKTDTARLCENLTRLIAPQNCHVHIDLIAGLAGENLSSFRESFNRAYALQANMLQLGFLKILHGSQMERQPETYRCAYSPEPPYQVTSTPWLNEEDLLLLHRAEDALERLYNSGRFRRTLQYLLQTLPLTPFDLFCEFGEYAVTRQTECPSLEEYTQWVFSFFRERPEINPTRLRDLLLTDRMATNSSDILPACLRVEDVNLRRAKQFLYATDPPQKGVRRSVAILYDSEQIIYCDYTKKHPVSGEYPLKYEHIVNILN